jgi:hypothetical protein
MGSVPSLPESLMKNQELVTDLCRFAEGIVTESAVRKKWRLQEEAWNLLGEDGEFVRAVEETRVQRIRSGASKRERAQQLIAEKGPSTLDKILSDGRSNPRHLIDAVKALDDLAEGGPRAVRDDLERVTVTINLGADTRAQGLESDPADVVVVDAMVRPNRTIGDWDSPKRIAAEQPAIEADNFDPQEAIPVKRGRGRPLGSKNKPKVIEQPGLPGFDV